MTALTIEIDASQLTAILQTVAEVLEPEKVVDEAATIILNHTRQRYLQEVNPDGKAWIPSKAATKRRRAGGTGTLFETGTLWRSIQLAAEHGENERVIEAGAYSEKGTEYGQFHNFGVPGLFPVRQFMGVPESDIELFEARMMQKVAEALNL